MTRSPRLLQALLAGSAPAAVALALSAAPVSAQPADPARMTADMDELRDLIHLQTEEFASAMQLELSVEYGEEPHIQPVLRAEDGSLYAYEITLTQPRVVVEGVFEAAMVDAMITAYPMEDATQWLFVTEGPVALSFSVEGEAVASLHLDQHESRTLLNREDRQLVRSIETASAGRVETADGHTLVSFEDLDIRRAIIPREREDRADVQTQFDLANLVITPPGSESPVAEFGTLHMGFRLDDADLAQLLAFQQASERFNEAMLGGGNEVDVAAVVADLIGFVEERGAPFNAEDFEIEATDVAIDYPDEDLVWSASALSFDFKVRGMDEGEGSLYVGYRHADLELGGNNLSMLTTETTPTDVALVLGLEGIPNSALRDAVKAAIDAMAADDPAAAESAIQSGLMEALADGGMSIVINEADWQSPTVHTRAGGRLTVNPAAGNGLVGTVTVLAEGLEQVEALLSEDEVIAEIGEADAMQIAGLTGLVRQSGEVALNEDGTHVRVYELELTEDGSVTLNGSPIDALMGLLSQP